MERSAVAGSGVDPYFGPGLETILAQSYEEIVNRPITRAQELDDQRFIETITEVIRDLARSGNAVILGRGGCVILKDMPSVLHVGLVARLEDRIVRLMARDHLEREEAEKYTMDSDKAREAYFRRFFKVSPLDPNLYDMVLNTSAMSLDYVTDLITQAANDLEKGKMVSQ